MLPDSGPSPSSAVRLDVWRRAPSLPGACPSGSLSTSRSCAPNERCSGRPRAPTPAPCAITARGRSSSVALRDVSGRHAVRVIRLARRAWFGPRWRVKGGKSGRLLSPRRRDNVRAPYSRGARCAPDVPAAAILTKRSRPVPTPRGSAPAGRPIISFARTRRLAGATTARVSGSCTSKNRRSGLPERRSCATRLMWQGPRRGIKGYGTTVSLTGTHDREGRLHPGRGRDQPATAQGAGPASSSRRNVRAKR